MAESRALDIDGHRIAIRELNPGVQGQPIVLLHGFLNSLAFWRNDDIFLQYGPCYAISLPGHYPAAFPPGFQPESLTAELVASLLLQALDQLFGAQPCTLAGISTGGFAALAVAATAPRRVGRVICISGFAQGRWSGLLGRYQKLMLRGLPGRLLVRSSLATGKLHPYVFTRLWRALVADWPAMRRNPSVAALNRSLFPNYRRTPLRALEVYLIAMPRIDISDRLAEITARTLVLAGDRDPIVPPRQAALIAERVPHAELVWFPGAGHVLQVEQPGQYRAILERWLGRADW